MDVTSPQLTAAPETQKKANAQAENPTTSSSQMPTDPKKGLDIFKIIIIVLAALLILSITYFIYTLL